MWWLKRFVGWAVNGLTWLVTPTQALAAVVGLASMIAAIALRVPIWAWPLVLVSTFGAAVWAINQGLALRERLLQRQKSIPVAISELTQRGVAFRALSDASGLPDTISFIFDEVTIANLSTTKSLGLELYLHLTGEGYDYKISCSPRDVWGRDLRHRNGLFAPTYLESPIQIAPGSVVTGRPAFLHAPLNAEEQLTWAKAFTGDNTLACHIIVHDIISGVELRLRLPTKYRGRPN